MTNQMVCHEYLSLLRLVVIMIRLRSLFACCCYFLGLVFCFDCGALVVMIVESFPRMTSQVACHEYLSPCRRFLGIFLRASRRMSRCARLFQLLGSYLTSLTTIPHLTTSLTTSSWFIFRCCPRLVDCCIRTDDH